MDQYTVRDVEKLAKLPRRRIRSLVEAGLVSPTRGPRNTWLFTFQDLIVLKGAKTLATARVPRKRIRSSVEELRRKLPAAAPLSGLSLSTEPDGVVIKEGDRRWRAESGQYLLGFENAPLEPIPADSLRFPARQASDPPESAEAWFERALGLEMQDPDAALEAYDKALSLEPGLVKARINLGCLLHETGRLERAETVYRGGLRGGGDDDPLLLYDLGVLLDDRGRKRDAIQTYEAALRIDPRFADCHYNLALLCRTLGRPRDAIQHMAAYRRLTATTRSE
jgi:tetratricopeptide (TPR) repeat protein